MQIVLNLASQEFNWALFCNVISKMMFDSPAEDDHGAGGLGMRVPEHLKLPRFSCHCNCTLEVKHTQNSAQNWKPSGSDLSVQLNSTPLHYFADSNRELRNLDIGGCNWVRGWYTSLFWHHPSASPDVIHVESGGPTSVSEHNPQQLISQLEPDGKLVRSDSMSERGERFLS